MRRVEEGGRAIKMMTMNGSYYRTLQDVELIIEINIERIEVRKRLNYGCYAFMLLLVYVSLISMNYLIEYL